MANLPIRTSSPIRKQKHSPRHLRRASTFPADAGYSQYPSDISPQNPSSSHPSLCSSVTAPLPGPHQTPFQLDQPSSHHRNTYPQPQTQTQTQTHFPISPVHQQELTSFVTHTENEDIQTWLRSILPLVDPLSTLPSELEPLVSGNPVNHDTSHEFHLSPQTSTDTLEAKTANVILSNPIHASMNTTPPPSLSLRRRVRGRRTSPNSTLMCPECNQGYSRRDNLRAHMRMHNGDRPYQCSDCGERFKWASTLKSHEVSNKCRKDGSYRRRSRSSTRSRSSGNEISSAPSVHSLPAAPGVDDCSRNCTNFAASHPSKGVDFVTHSSLGTLGTHERSEKDLGSVLGYIRLATIPNNCEPSETVVEPNQIESPTNVPVNNMEPLLPESVLPIPCMDSSEAQTLCNEFSFGFEDSHESGI